MLTEPNTFVRIATDCPVEKGVVPVSTRAVAPAHAIHFEMLTSSPYRYTNEELIFAVHLQRSDLTPEDLDEARRLELWQALFTRSHPCMRASPLPKKFGWGVHSDAEGRLALHCAASAAYRELVRAGERGELKLTSAMRSKRG